MPTVPATIVIALATMSARVGAGQTAFQQPTFPEFAPNVKDVAVALMPELRARGVVNDDSPTVAVSQTWPIDKLPNDELPIANATTKEASQNGNTPTPGSPAFFEDAKQLLFASYAAYECADALNNNTCFYCESMDPPLRFVRVVGPEDAVTQAWVGWQPPAASWASGSPFADDARSGRVVVAFRGTTDVQSLLADLAVKQVQPASQRRQVDAIARDLAGISRMQGLPAEASEVLRRSAAADVVLDRAGQVSMALAANGTSSTLSAEELASLLEQYKPCVNCTFHDGFWRAFLNVAAVGEDGNVEHGLIFTIAEVLRKGMLELNPSLSTSMEENGFPEDVPLPSIAFTGHSLGGAVTTIGAVVTATLLAPLGINGLRQPKIRAVTFGAPRFCNRRAAEYFEESLPRLGSDLRIERHVNDHDIVPSLLPKGLVGLTPRTRIRDIVGALTQPADQLLRSLAEMMVFDASEGYRHVGTEYWMHASEGSNEPIPLPYTFTNPTFGTPFMCSMANVTHPLSASDVVLSTCESARDGGCQGPELYPMLLDDNDNETFTEAEGWARWAGCFSGFIVGSSLRAGIPPVAPWPGVSDPANWTAVAAEWQREVRAFDPRAGSPLPACVRNHEQYLGVSLVGCAWPRTSLCGQEARAGVSPMDIFSAIAKWPSLLSSLGGVVQAAASG